MTIEELNNLQTVPAGWSKVTYDDGAFILMNVPTLTAADQTIEEENPLDSNPTVVYYKKGDVVKAFYDRRLIDDEEEPLCEILGPFDKENKYGGPKLKETIVEVDQDTGEVTRTTKYYISTIGASSMYSPYGEYGQQYYQFGPLDTTAGLYETSIIDGEGDPVFDFGTEPSQKNVSYTTTSRPMSVTLDFGKYKANQLLDLPVSDQSVEYSANCVNSNYPVALTPARDWVVREYDTSTSSWVDTTDKLTGWSDTEQNKKIDHEVSDTVSTDFDDRNLYAVYLTSVSANITYRNGFDPEHIVESADGRNTFIGGDYSLSGVSDLNFTSDATHQFVRWESNDEHFVPRYDKTDSKWKLNIIPDGTEDDIHVHDIELTAVWDPLTRVTYHNNKPDTPVATLDDRQFSCGTHELSGLSDLGNSFAYEGYAFGGWMMETSGDHYLEYDRASEKWNIVVAEFPAPVDLYATWQKEVKIKYHGNGGETTGGETTIIDARNFVETDSYPLSAISDIGFHKTGTGVSYVFAGWAISQDGEIAYNDASNIYIDIEHFSNIDLYAVWREEIEVYITYHKNDDSGEQPIPDSRWPIRIPGNYDLELNQFTKEDYHFAGWDDQPSGEGHTPTIKYFDGEQLAFNQNAEVDLYAVWAHDQLVVSYRPVKIDATGSMPPALVDWGTDYTIQDCGYGMPGSGYVFVAWETVSGGQRTRFLPSAVVNIKQDQVFDAVWFYEGVAQNCDGETFTPEQEKYIKEHICKIWFHSGWGLNEHYEQCCASGREVYLMPEQFSQDRPDYTFLGWGVAVNDVVVYEDQALFIPMECPTKLYAQWKKKDGDGPDIDIDEEPCIEGYDPLPVIFRDMSDVRSFKTKFWRWDFGDSILYGTDSSATTTADFFDENSEYYRFELPGDDDVHRVGAANGFCVCVQDPDDESKEICTKQFLWKDNVDFFHDNVDQCLMNIDYDDKWKSYHYDGPKDPCDIMVWFDDTGSIDANRYKTGLRNSLTNIIQELSAVNPNSRIGMIQNRATNADSTGSTRGPRALLPAYGMRMDFTNSSAVIMNTAKLQQGAKSYVYNSDEGSPRVQYPDAGLVVYQGAASENTWDLMDTLTVNQWCQVGVDEINHQSFSWSNNTKARKVLVAATDEAYDCFCALNNFYGCNNTYNPTARWGGWDQYCVDSTTKYDFNRVKALLDEYDAELHFVWFDDAGGDSKLYFGNVMASGDAIKTRGWNPDKISHTFVEVQMVNNLPTIRYKHATTGEIRTYNAAPNFIFNYGPDVLANEIDKTVIMVDRANINGREVTYKGQNANTPSAADCLDNGVLKQYAYESLLTVDFFNEIKSREGKITFVDEMGFDRFNDLAEEIGGGRIKTHRCQTANFNRVLLDIVKDQKIQIKHFTGINFKSSTESTSGSGFIDFKKYDMYDNGNQHRFLRLPGDTYATFVGVTGIDDRILPDQCARNSCEKEYDFGNSVAHIYKGPGLYYATMLCSSENQSAKEAGLQGMELADYIYDACDLTQQTKEECDADKEYTAGCWINVLPVCPCVSGFHVYGTYQGNSWAPDSLPHDSPNRKFLTITGDNYSCDNGQMGLAATGYVGFNCEVEFTDFDGNTRKTKAVSGYAPYLQVGASGRLVPRSLPVTGACMDWSDWNSDYMQKDISEFGAIVRGWPHWTTRTLDASGNIDWENGTEESIHTVSGDHVYTMPGLYSVGISPIFDKERIRKYMPTVTDYEDCAESTLVKSASGCCVLVVEIPPKFEETPITCNEGNAQNEHPSVVTEIRPHVIAGSYPISRIDWDFGDGSEILTISTEGYKEYKKDVIGNLGPGSFVKYQTKTSTAYPMKDLYTSAENGYMNGNPIRNNFESKMTSGWEYERNPYGRLDARDYNVTHVYTRTHVTDHPGGYDLKCSAYAENTNTCVTACVRVLSGGAGLPDFDSVEGYVEMVDVRSDSTFETNVVMQSQKNDRLYVNRIIDTDEPYNPSPIPVPVPTGSSGSGDDTHGKTYYCFVGKGGDDDFTVCVEDKPHAEVMTLKLTTHLGVGHKKYVIDSGDQEWVNDTIIEIVVPEALYEDYMTRDGDNWTFEIPNVLLSWDVVDGDASRDEVAANVNLNGKWQKLSPKIVITGSDSSPDATVSLLVSKDYNDEYKIIDPPQTDDGGYTSIMTRECQYVKTFPD